MARTQSKLNDASSEVIGEEILKQDPTGLPETKESNIVIAKQMPKEQEMVKFIFLNGRDPGVALHFHYSSANCPLKNYTLYHGMEHVLPREIVDHLESCGEAQYGYKPGIEGHPEMYVKSHKYIFQCRPVKQSA
jgi:hypothetical protein